MLKAVLLTFFSLLLTVSAEACYCGPNEEYSECANGGCFPRNCSQVGSPSYCPKIDPDDCVEGCICIEGYLRDKFGNCIPEDECPCLCGTNEEFSDCANARCFPRECFQLKSHIIGKKRYCPKVDPADCEKGCVCKKGYVRDKWGHCILEKECPCLCGSNEEFSACANGGCFPRNCSQAGKPKYCPKIDPADCKDGCICKEGYLRDKQGKCIPEKDCPCPCGPNEVFSECANGGCFPRDCAHVKKPKYCPKIDPAYCKEGCICKEGYFRDKWGKCILKKDCPGICGSNEIFSECANGGCFPRNCSQAGKPRYCPKIDPADCIEGCICKEGYLRDKQGKCIPKKKCPTLCSGKNESYSDCSNAGCDATTCAQNGFKVPCVEFNSTDCVKGCRCDDGYLRADDGICIPRVECPSCGGDSNATQGCGINCGRHCSNYMLENVPCPLRPCFINSCDCKPDYVFDDNIGKCVLPEDCTAVSSTKPSGNCKDAVDRLILGNLNFTGRFLNEMVLNDTVDRIISPFSVLFPLASFALYTKTGESFDQLMSILNLKSKDEIRCVFSELLNIYKSQSEFALELASKVYVTNTDELTNEFKGDTRTVFQTEGESIDFSKSEEAAETINNWVANKTNNLIKDLVSPSYLDASTQILLANAIYFAAKWEDPFNPISTSDRDFYVSPQKTIKVKSMRSNSRYKYAEVSSIDAKVLELPYKGDGVRYVAILPNEKDGLVDLVAKLQDPNVLKDALGQLKLERVIVNLPRYETGSTVDLKILLRSLKVTNLFSPITSQLDGILQTNPKIGISVAVQKANINLDETGTVATAANAFVGRPSGRPQDPLVFDADHPFVYYIFVKDAPIFAGVLTGRKKVE